MIVSEARIAANRRNGALGKGPTSERGKSISSQNSLIHGLSGKGLVTPEGDAEAIARRAREFTADMRPRSEAGAALIGQMAILSVRVERAAEYDSAATAHRVRHAVDAFDEGRIDDAAALFATLADDPRSTLRKLRKSPEGVERLLDAWDDLRCDLTVGTWGEEQVERAVHLTGLKSRHAGGTLLGALSRALDGDFAALDDEEGAGLDVEARKAWAKARLFGAIDEQTAGLEAHAETLDYETIDLDRAEAPGRALFDASKPACLARRYEADASRGFFRALREFRKVEADFAASAQPAQARPSTQTPDPTPASPPAKMGSSRETPPPAERMPGRSVPDAVPTEVAVVRDGAGQPLSIGRPAQATA